MENIPMLQKWFRSISIYFDKRMATVLLLGFSSGFPLLLVLGTLNLWLKDSGVSYTLIGVFSLAKIPYSFKWIWSPIVDRVNLPFLSHMGRRRSWALFSQALLLIAILGMSMINPAENLWTLAVFALFVAFASATQDIVLDAYRIESFKDREQGAGTATFVMGYRFGLLFSGAFALLLAKEMSWNNVYLIMSMGAIIGMGAVLASPEPASSMDTKLGRIRGDFKQRLQLFMRKAVVNPFMDFMKRPHWALILLFIFLYKMGDAYIGPMAYPFYDDMGFDKVEIATITKIYGMIATVVGSIIGGVIVHRYGILKALLACGIFQCFSNLMFVVQAHAGHNIYVLMGTISIENISGGMATTAFVAYLSSLCNVLYTATQYALLSSLMGLARDVVAASSGFLKEHISWEMFFSITTLMAVPGLLVILHLMKLDKKNT